VLSEGKDKLHVTRVLLFEMAWEMERERRICLLIFCGSEMEKVNLVCM
jgi:hypothetical protein